jgi:squalene-associated FAD-dependent desaturase
VAHASEIPIAVIGAGYAGCAAAVTLASAGRRTVLFEQAPTLGGRARRVTLDGVNVDNGQHILIGAYRQTLELIARVRDNAADALDACLTRMPLAITPLGAAAEHTVGMRVRALPAPLHLAAGILTARGLRLRERLQVIRAYRQLDGADYRCPPGQRVSECFAAMPYAAMAGLWSPLCLAALNTPAHRASAQVFANVLRETFAAEARASDLLIPSVDLSALFPDAAARYVSERGGEVRVSTTVRRVTAADHAAIVDTGHGDERFAAVLVAVGPHQLAATIDRRAATSDASNEPRPDGPWHDALARIDAFDYESITTAYLAYAAPIALPGPMARLDDLPGQWAFDCTRALAANALPQARALLSIVVSGGGPHDHLPHDELVGRLDAQLRRLVPEVPALVWSRVVAERRATYACTPDLPRPAAGRVAPRLYLAGDYTLAELPATLEAATRSGVIAAQALLAELAAPGH